MITWLMLTALIGKPEFPKCEQFKGGVAQAQCELAVAEHSWGGRDCSNPTERQDREACSLLAFLRSDVELNVVWTKVLSTIAVRRSMAELPANVADGVVRELKSAEVNWVEYRVAHCNSLASYMRTGDNELRHKCLTQLTDERISELNSFLPSDQVR